MTPMTVIQMTVRAYMKQGEVALEYTRAMLHILRPDLKTEGEQNAYLEGFKEAWKLGASAILVMGNARFEREGDAE